MKKVLLLLVLMFATACEAPVERPGLTVEDFTESMRLRNLHRIRVENNPKLSKALGTRAVDIYVANQQLIAVQVPFDRDAGAYQSYFDGYTKLNRVVTINRNMLIVADADVQKEIIEAFNRM
jgi:hypothetical protein